MKQILLDDHNVNDISDLTGYEVYDLYNTLEDKKMLNQREIEYIYPIEPKCWLKYAKKEMVFHLHLMAVLFYELG